MLTTSFSEIILRIPAVIIAFAFHEWAHAMVADYFGDPTPRSQGRLSLNPFVHLDIMGTLLAIFFIFGWAKPVHTRPSF
jgi:Zn-dependent protease